MGGTADSGAAGYVQFRVGNRYDVGDITPLDHTILRNPQPKYGSKLLKSAYLSCNEGT